MRLLALGYPLPNLAIDNYNPLTAPSYFDYEAMYIDPFVVTKAVNDVVEATETYQAFDNRPVINGPSSANAVSAGEQLKRRLDETTRLLEAGGVVIVGGRPNVTVPGVLGFEGADRYSWLPAPSGASWGPPLLKPAEGKSIRIIAETHPAAGLIRDLRKRLIYRAVFDERHPAFRQHGRVIAVGGVGAPVAAEFNVLGGKVVFIPVLMPDDTTNSRMASAARIVDLAREIMALSGPPEEQPWARSIAVPGLEQVEAEVADARKTRDEAQARLSAAQDQLDGLASHRRLITEQGPNLTAAVRDALNIIGFTTEQTEEGGLTAESEGTRVLVEAEGSREEVVEWPYVRLQRRIEKRLFEGEITQPPRGLVVANGSRTRKPEERGSQFADTLRLACENYRFALITGDTLLEMVRRALGGATGAELTGMRRRLLSTNGLLEKPVALGDVEEKKEEKGALF